LRQVVGVEVADTPVGDAAMRLQRFEAGDGVAQRVRAGPVQQVEVDVIEHQAPAAALAGGDDAGAARVVRIDLADDEHLIARHRAGAQRLGERPAEHLFGTAFAVHLGRVEDAVTEFEGEAHGGHLLCPARGRFTHLPGAQAEGGQAGSIRQSHSVHRGLSDAILHRRGDTP
jgi:hypothetical protein